MESARLFMEIPIKTWTNLEFLALIAEYWKANHFQIQSITKILYVFWIQAEPPHLDTDVGIYCEIDGDMLILE